MKDGAVIVEELIPHRNRMKLIDRVLDVNEDRAVAESRTSPDWPLLEDGGVSPIVLIELVAQCAGIYIGWLERLKTGAKHGGSGWLVGVKQAEFFIDPIPLEKNILTEAVITKSFDNYREIDGFSRIGDTVIGNVTVQIFRSK